MGQPSIIIDKPQKITRKTNKINLLRRIIQLICFFLLPGLFIQIYTSTKALTMAFIHNNFSMQTNITDLIIVVSVFPVTMLLGRFFCGWICAMGSISDLLTFFRNQLKINELKAEESLDKMLRLIKYVILLFSVVYIWTLQIISIPQGVNPLDAFGILVSFDNLSLLFSSFLIATLLLAAILAVSFFVPRFFCKYFCPTGAILSLLSLPRLLVIKKPRETCRKCLICTKNCPMSIPLYQTDKSCSGECIECGKCVNNCPLDNCHMQLGVNVDSKKMAAIAVTSIVGLNYIGTITANAVYDTKQQTTTYSSSQSNTNSTTVSSSNYQDGTYQGSGTGFRGNTTVKVTVKGGKITAISEISYSDDYQFFNRAWNTITEEILSAQGIDVDAVSGATYSSNGIKEAVADALNVTYDNPNSSTQGGNQGGGHGGGPGGMPGGGSRMF